jgi:hypothetical protein
MNGSCIGCGYCVEDPYDEDEEYWELMLTYWDKENAKLEQRMVLLDRWIKAKKREHLKVVK